MAWGIGLSLHLSAERFLPSSPSPFVVCVLRLCVIGKAAVCKISSELYARYCGKSEQWKHEVFRKDIAKWDTESA